MPVSTIIGPNGVAVAVVDEDTKVDIRRYCGFPAYGVGTSGFFEMGQWLPNYLQLELRMNMLTVSEFSRVTYMLTYLQNLEDDLYGMREAMIVDSAAVFHRNKDEPSDRHTEFNWWCKHLVNFLGVRPGPNFEGNGGRPRMIV